MTPLCAERVLDLEHDRQPDRDHHDRRGGVRDPHRQEARRDHEAEDDAGGAPSDRMNDAEGNALVQIPLLHGEGNHEAPDVQHDGAVEVDRCRFACAEDSQERIQEKREHRRRKQRDRVTHPPDRHQHCDRRQSTRRLVSRIDLEEHQKQKGADSKPEADPLGGTSLGSRVVGH